LKHRPRKHLARVVALAAVGTSLPARADPPRVPASEGTVLTIDAGDLVVDFGSDKGAQEGQSVELWRPMRLRHPVTGQVLTDRFRIGTVHLTQVRPTLSLAKADGTFLRPPAAGDAVRLQEDPARSAPILRSMDAVPAPPPVRAIPTDPDALALADLFTSLQGVDPAGRARAYGEFTKARPASRFARVLREEIQALVSGAAERNAGEHGPTAPPARPASFAPFERVPEGVPQQLAIELDQKYVGAVVHVRSHGEAAYRSIAMSAIGPRYWSATIPADAIRDSGLEYFVEGVPAEGAAIAVAGKADDPRRAEVEGSHRAAPPGRTLAQAALWSELATFNTKKANDWVFQTEGNFGWRLADEGIRAVRSGFGVIRGKGGSLDNLDVRGLPPTSVGLTYGYVEAELGITPVFGLIGRPIVGLRDDGIEGGAQGFARIGNDLRTNLLLGGEVLGGVGLRGIVELDWRTIPRVPVMFRSEVTNQPAGSGGDIGVRAIAQAGYQIVKDFTVSARGSYQGRTINHAGPGGGLGASYQW
jgi:hypothetical protein